MRNTSTRPIYYDTETTGVKADNDKIIEIAAYDPVNDLSFERLIDPERPIPPEASAIHNITNEMVQGKPSFEIIGQEFIEFCEGEVILIAHNNDAFDLPFLQNSFHNYGLEMPSKWRFLDSLKWARRYRSDLPKHSLQFLREYFGFPPNNAHRALDDVLVLHQVFSELIDDIPIDKAYELMQEARDIKHMPFGKYQGMPLTKVPKDYLNWLDKNGAFAKKENEQLKQSLEKLGML